jgi:hypothetical protein
LTWPLGRQLSAYLPRVNVACDFDTLYSAWILAYETHALTTAPAEFAQLNIFHPADHVLFYGPTEFGALPFFASVFLVTGNPALALNLTLLGCIALTATALHLVVYRWTESHLAGFLAGWTLLTTRWTLWEWLPTAPHDAVLQYFPLIILLGTTVSRRLGYILGFGALVALQCLTDPVYVAPAVIGPIGVLALAQLARRNTRGDSLVLLGVVGIATLLLLPLYWGYLHVRTQIPDLAHQTFWPAQVALEGSILTGWGPFGQPSPLAVPPAALLLIAVGVTRLILDTEEGRQRRHAWLHGIYWVVIGAVISVGPFMNWGEGKLQLPHARLLDWLGIPLYETIRVPARLGVAALMGLAILVGLAFAECARPIAMLRRWPLVEAAWRIGLAALTAAAMYAGLVSDWSLPLAFSRPALPHVYPIAPVPSLDPSLLEALRRQTGPLLELPVGDLQRPAPARDARAMYRSIFHWRPLLNGYSSYWPAGFPQRMSLANRLPDAAALAMLRRDTGLDTIIVHSEELRRWRRPVWFSLAARGEGYGLRLVARYGGDLLFTTSDSVATEPRTIEGDCRPEGQSGCREGSLRPLQRETAKPSERGRAATQPVASEGEPLRGPGSGR